MKGLNFHISPAKFILLGVCMGSAYFLFDSVTSTYPSAQESFFMNPFSGIMLFFFSSIALFVVFITLFGPKRKR